MGYGRYNKQYELTPHYVGLAAVPVSEALEEAAPAPERPPLPAAPGVSKAWQDATEAARQKYHRLEPSYHDTVRARVLQRGVHIPYILLRANIEKGSDALAVAKETNGNNHAKGMVSFLGRGIVPSVVNVEAVGIAVDAARTFCDAELVEQLDVAYKAWQEATEHVELANLPETA